MENNNKDIKAGEKVYYYDDSGDRVQRTVDWVLVPKSKVFFTNGGWMPLGEVYPINESATNQVTTTTTTNGDNVNHPSHYTKGGIETLDFIKAKLNGGGYAGYLTGNIFKYLARYEHKNGLEDLKKAEFYLKELIALKSELKRMGV